MATIYIPFATATGEVELMAEAIAEGVKEYGGEGVPAYVPPVEPRLEVLLQDHFRRMLHERAMNEYPLADAEELLKADGAAFGTPTVYAGPASEMKDFIDSVFQSRRDGELFNKPAATFTATHVGESGQELTKLMMWAPLSLLGFMLIGMPQTVPNLTANYDQSLVLGPDHRKHPQAPRILSQSEWTQCYVIGARLALVAERVKDVAGSDVLLRSHVEKAQSRT